MENSKTSLNKVIEQCQAGGGGYDQLPLPLLPIKKAGRVLSREEKKSRNLQNEED